MTVLENPRANPGLARAICRGLAAADGATDLLSLLRAVCPPGAGDFVDLRDGDVRQETLQVCLALGLLRLDGNKVHLELPQEEWGATQTTDAFRRLLRRRLMAAALTTDAFSRGIGAFTGAIAWLLAQDPLRPIEGWGKSARGEDAERLQLQNLGHANRLITNGAFQWPAFVRWSLFLGFAVQIRIRQRPRIDLLTPDPAVAVEDELPPAGEVAARPFIATLASALPVVDGGHVRGSVEAKWLGDAPPAAVSPALSVALLRLEAAGKLRLLNVSDAPAEDRAVLHAGNDHRTFSSVVIGADDV